MSSRPFALLREASVDAVRSAVQDAVARWRAAWGIAGDEISVGCERAWISPLRMPAWQGGRAADGQSLWLAGGDDVAAQLQRLMYPHDRSVTAGAVSSLAEAAAQGAQEALMAALCELLPAGQAPAGATAAEMAYASGAVLATVQCGRAAVHALFNHGAVQAITSLASVRQGGAAGGALLAPLAPVAYRAVLAPMPLRLEVGLGSTEVTLGSLRTLAVGDVIRLPRRADEPLAVHGPEGQALLAGYLGTQAGHLALELAPHQSKNGVKQ